MSAVVAVRRAPVVATGYRLPDDHELIRQAWVRLRRELPPLSGREFIGVFDEAAGDYLVCATRGDADPPPPAERETWQLAGGAYLAATVSGVAPAVYAQLPEFFARIAQGTIRDRDRPLLEIYRSPGVVDLLVPVKPAQMPD